LAKDRSLYLSTPYVDTIYGNAGNECYFFVCSPIGARTKMSSSAIKGVLSFDLVLMISLNLAVIIGKL